MPQSLPKHLKPVVILWRDAFQDSDKDDTVKALLEYVEKDCLRYTCGYLIGKTKEFVVVATTYDDFHKKPKYMGVFSIPHGMVIKIFKCSSTSRSNRSPSKLSLSSPPPSLPLGYIYETGSSQPNA